MKLPLSYVRIAVASLVIAASLPSFAADATTCPQQININKASAEQLTQCLTHVGPKTAEAIVAYRTAHGDFKTVADIAAVKGVGEKRAAKLEPKLTIEDSK